MEKSGRLTDAQLIDIINGRNTDYPSIEDIEDSLFDRLMIAAVSEPWYGENYN
jgi:hypothetical protein